MIAAQVFHECPGCGVEMIGGGRYCFDCQQIMAGVSPCGQEQEAEDYSRRARMLTNLFWASVALSLFWYLIWCYRDYIIACWDLWFGGGLSE